MKTKHWLIVAAALSASVAAHHAFADDQPGTVPADSATTPAPLVVSPPENPDHAAKKKKTSTGKKTASTPKKSSASEPMAPPAPVAPGPAVVTQRNVNVRGQAAINSEVIARLKKGDHVNVIEEVTLKKPKTDEPAKWAKISLPTNSTVWVNSTFISNGVDKTVAPKKLNVRSGPGENYSVVARLSKGTVVKEIESKGEWMKIEPPADSYGFIAAHLLSNEAASAPAPIPVVVASTPPPPPITPLTETPVAAPLTPAVPAEPVVPQPVVPAPATPPVPAVPVETAVVPTPPAPAPTEAVPATPPAEEILVKRVVSREGFVKRSVSIQSPTYFALESLDTGKTINYLYSPSTNLVLKDFKGKRIVVTGEEMLDERWPNTPVINVDSLQTVP